jgi:hypothetical protein
MKRNLTKWLAIAALLFPMLAPAELIHYKGTGRDVSQGRGRSLSLNLKVFLVVDTETENITLIRYAAAFGEKHYGVSAVTNAHFVHVTGAKSTYTAITRVLSDCDREAGRTGEGALCSGLDAQLALNNSASTYTFPKLFKSSGSGVSFSGGDPVLGEDWFQAVYDRPATVSSNEAGESLEDAVKRLVSQLEAQGYTR